MGEPTAEIVPNRETIKSIQALVRNVQGKITKVYNLTDIPDAASAIG